MEIKRLQILKATAECFMDQGYQNTSVQDIASHCNVSKATIYKCFPSKEDLGAAAAFYLTEEMILQIETVMGRKDLSGREKLKQCMIHRISSYVEKSRFIDVLLFSFDTQHREKYIPAINRSKYYIFSLFTKIIGEVYQIEDELAASELSINVNGLMREISFIAGDNKMELESEKIAEFILDSLEALHKQRKGKPLLLTKEQMKRWQGSSHEQVLGEKFQRIQLIGKLRRQASQCGDDNRREKLCSAIDLLCDEMQKEKGNTVITEALLVYLKQEHLLEETAVALENLND